MNEYVRKILKKNCYSELHELFVKTTNPVKEITESYAAFENLLSVIEWEKFNTYLFLHIGDGSKCTTGALFSFMSESVNFSIDPGIHTKVLDEFIERHKVERFMYFPVKWEEYKEKYSGLREKYKTNLVMVHSHVDTKEIMKSFPGWEYAYVNPCCFPRRQTLSLQEQKRMGVKCILNGRDENIMSEKNEVFIYQNMNNFVADEKKI